MVVGIINNYHPNVSGFQSVTYSIKNKPLQKFEATEKLKFELVNKKGV